MHSHIRMFVAAALDSVTESRTELAPRCLEVFGQALQIRPKGRPPESKAIGASRVFVAQKHHLLFPTKGRVIAHYNPCRVVGPSLRFGVVEQLDHGAGRNVAGQGFSGVDVVPIRHDPLPNAVGSFHLDGCR